MLCILGIFCFLCSCALGQNISVRPNAVNIGALFTFNSTIGRASKVAIAAAVNDINNDSSILAGTKLVVQMQDSNCSGFLGIVQGTRFMCFHEINSTCFFSISDKTTIHMVTHD
jgi:glutamate receptor, ionotropic, plant